MFCLSKNGRHLSLVVRLRYFVDLFLGEVRIRVVNGRCVNLRAVRGSGLHGPTSSTEFFRNTLQGVRRKTVASSLDPQVSPKSQET